MTDNGLLLRYRHKQLVGVPPVFRGFYTGDNLKRAMSRASSRPNG